MDGATVSLKADLAEIPRMNTWLERRLEALGVADEVAQRVKLCLNEAAENAIRYGFDTAQDDALRVSLGAGADCVELRLDDSGRPFDPLAVDDPEKMQSVETAQIGGFGILLMRDAATELSYARKDGRNILTARFCPR